MLDRTITIVLCSSGPLRLSQQSPGSESVGSPRGGVYVKRVKRNRIAIS